jgi:hypothetical protein
LAFDTTLEESKRAGISRSKIGNLTHMDTFERVDLASLSLDEILRKRKGLRRKLAQRELKPVRTTRRGLYRLPGILSLVAQSRHLAGGMFKKQ